MKRIEKVNSSRLLTHFIDFVHDLYKDDPYYVPELFIAQRDLLTPGKHPFHEHSSMQLFLAYDNDKITGRIAAILNNNYNTYNNVQEGFFGFFDCINDQSTADMLFSEAGKWLKHKGAVKVMGPVNPSTNEPAGLLVKGFDSPPVVMMTYNAPYYIELIEHAGFTKNVDLIAYKLTAADYQDKRYAGLAEAVHKRLASRNITFRPVNFKNFKEEVKNLREVYNSAWDKNTGFVPMTEKEFNYLAKDLKLILDKDFCMVAEHEGKIVGFSLAIPDINQALIKIKKGRLFPTGIFTLLTRKKYINNIRILALGVVEGYRKSGIDIYFYKSIIENGIRKKFLSAEASWILEHNIPMNKAILGINGKPYKRTEFTKSSYEEKLLITGASGFVGYHLIKEALLQDMEVFAAVRKTSVVSHLQQLPVHIVYPHFQNIEQLKKDLETYGITHIVHAAAVTKANTQDEYNYANAVFTRNLAQAAGGAAIELQNFVFISSLAAMGPSTHDLPVYENDIPAPVTFYGKSKLLAEQYLSEFSTLPLTGLRPTAVYGPREKDLFIVLKMIRRGLEMYIGRIQQKLSFVYVKDLADSVFKALSLQPNGEYYHISDGETYDRYALANITKSLLGSHTIRLHVPLRFVKFFLGIQDRIKTTAGKVSILNTDKLKELTASWECSIAKARRDLQYQPQFQLKEGLALTMEWYRANKWL